MMRGLRRAMRGPEWKGSGRYLVVCRCGWGVAVEAWKQEAAKRAHEVAVKAEAGAFECEHVIELGREVGDVGEWPVPEWRR